VTARRGGEEISMRNCLRLFLLPLAPLLLAGCVAGQSLGTDYEAQPAAVPAEGTSVLLKVTEDRPYVTSGDKAPYYVGKYRAGFGNPWDVTTRDNVPLVDVLRGDIAEELVALGHPVKDAPPADRQMSVSIRDWNFDGYQNGEFWYELLVTVQSADGAALASSVVKNRVGITGTLWEGAKGGFERDMPKLYPQVIRQLVRDNPEVSAALATP
jgi:hypothetical protein